MNISAAKTYIELLVLSRSMANGKKMYEFQKRCLDGIYICLRGDYIQGPETGKMMGSRPSEKVDKSGDSGIIKVGSDKAMISSIDSPIEQKHTGKGNPNAILTYDVPLNNRQQALLDTLPDYDSRITVDRKSVNMADLSALTAKTGDEFAMFTKGNERLIIRGDNRKVNIGIDEAKKLSPSGI